MDLDPRKKTYPNPEPILNLEPDKSINNTHIVQVESHPYLNQSRLLEFCKERGIYLTAYSPLGSPDRPWAKPDEPKLLDDLKISKMAEKYKKSPAQIVLGWQVK